MNNVSLPSMQSIIPDAKRRMRLTVTLTIYGCILSVSAVHVYLISRPPWYVDAKHLELWTAVFFSLAALIGALIVVPVPIYHLRDRAQTPGGVLIWVAIGLGFGIFTPLFTGAFFPLTSIPIDYIQGDYVAGELFSLVIDSILIAPWSFIVEGTPAILTGLAAGAFLAIGGYILDRLNTSNDRRISRYGPWIAAFALGLPILIFALFGPPETIRDLGLS